LELVEQSLPLNQMDWWA
jgi:hypothetical protein